MMWYQVVVDNIGTVYYGNNEIDANIILLGYSLTGDLNLPNSTALSPKGGSIFTTPLNLT